MPRNLTTLLARLLVVLAVLATVVVAVFEARERRSTADVVLTVDASDRIGRIAPIWDEINLWKLYLRFGVQQPDVSEYVGEGWLVQRAPWLRFARVNTILGGNWAPEIAPWCDRAEKSDAHPDVHPWECGKDGVPGAAAANELVGRVDGELVVDYRPLRLAVERLLKTGVAPHLNISSAPSAFTGGKVDYGFYHWNGAPVADLEGWSAFVEGAFRTLADLGTDGWRVSIINEPNCLILLGDDPKPHHVGYSGSPQDYARTFVATVRAIRRAAPAVSIQAGNYVTSATFPGEDNLAIYLRALREELDASGDVRWQDLPVISLSLYETPDTTLYEFLPKRVARLEKAQRDAGLEVKPIKVDELEIHHDVRAPFEERSAQRLDTTLFAASWHAEAQRLFLDSGKVVSTASWLTHSFDEGHGLAPYPKAAVYGMLGVLAGELRTVDDGETLKFAPTGRTHGLPRVAVYGGRRWRADVARSTDEAARDAAGRIARSLDALATRSRNRVRVLVVYHQNEPVQDDAPLRRALARDVELDVVGLPSGAWVARYLTVGGPEGVVWQGERSSPLRWHDAGCTRADDGRVTLAPRPMDANTVWLFELERRPRCP
ncbi:MAG TPA: hypothetical protein VIS07_00760 [Candidatus Binatia bacterium]